MLEDRVNGVAIEGADHCFFVDLCNLLVQRERLTYLPQLVQVNL